MEEVNPTEILNEKIRKEILRYIEKHGKEPKKIFLGIEETQIIKSNMPNTFTKEKTKNNLVGIFCNKFPMYSLNFSKSCIEAI